MSFESNFSGANTESRDDTAIQERLLKHIDMYAIAETVVPERSIALYMRDRKLIESAEYLLSHAKSEWVATAIESKEKSEAVAFMIEGLSNGNQDIVRAIVKYFCRSYERFDSSDTDKMISTILGMGDMENSLLLLRVLNKCKMDSEVATIDEHIGKHCTQFRDELLFALVENDRVGDLVYELTPATCSQLLHRVFSGTNAELKRKFARIAYLAGNVELAKLCPQMLKSDDIELVRCAANEISRFIELISQEQLTKLVLSALRTPDPVVYSKLYKLHWSLLPEGQKAFDDATVALLKNALEREESQALEILQNLSGYGSSDAFGALIERVYREVFNVERPADVSIHMYFILGKCRNMKVLQADFVDRLIAYRQVDVLSIIRSSYLESHGVDIAKRTFELCKTDSARYSFTKKLRPVATDAEWVMPALKQLLDEATLGTIYEVYGFLRTFMHAIPRAIIISLCIEKLKTVIISPVSELDYLHIAHLLDIIEDRNLSDLTANISPDVIIGKVVYSGFEAPQKLAFRYLHLLSENKASEVCKHILEHWYQYPPDVILSKNSFFILDEGQRFDLLKRHIDAGSLTVVGALKYIGKEDIALGEAFLNEFSGTPLAEEMVTAPNLGRSIEGFDDPEKTFALRPLSSTNTSKISIIPGKLGTQRILRHLSVGSFERWRMAFEACEVWKEHGFDYVPIEPIASFSPTPDSTSDIDVMTAVLDLSLGHWISKFSRFKKELIDEQKKIFEVFTNILGTSYGPSSHFHHYNFVLKFFRDKNGMVDFARKPRIYMIDFKYSRKEWRV